MQQQAQMQQMQAQTELAQARAKADTGLGLERISRIQENQALATERESAAHRDEEAALLNLVKAIKEMESVDLSHLERLLAMSQMLKQQEQQQDAESTMKQGVIQSSAAQQLSPVNNPNTAQSMVPGM